MPLVCKLLWFLIILWHLIRQFMDGCKKSLIRFPRIPLLDKSPTIWTTISLSLFNWHTFSTLIFGAIVFATSFFTFVEWLIISCILYLAKSFITVSHLQVVSKSIRYWLHLENTNKTVASRFRSIHLVAILKFKWYENI